jgi:alpha/beta superfamily hydrolase
MQSSVVAAIWEALARQSIAAFRFNFRGVGNSEGKFADGVGEREDVKAAIDSVASTEGIDVKRIGLAGYSFGAMMALPVARRDERVSMLALVSAPLSDTNWEQLKAYPRPKLYLVGEADQMVGIERVREKMKDIPNPEQYQIIPGADHFLAGYEEEIASRVSRFFAAGFSKNLT